MGINTNERYDRIFDLLFLYMTHSHDSDPNQWWTKEEENGIKHGLTAIFIILARSIQSQC